MIEEANQLLNHNWSETEKMLVKKVIDNLIYYKSVIPKSLKKDVQDLLHMANATKTHYELLKENKCKQIKIIRRNSF